MSCHEPVPLLAITWVPRGRDLVAAPQPERGCAVVIRRVTLPPTRAVAWEAVLEWEGIAEVQPLTPPMLDVQVVQHLAIAWLVGACWGRARGIDACVGVVQRKAGAFAPLSSNTKLLLEELVGEMLAGDAP